MAYFRGALILTHFQDGGLLYREVKFKELNLNHFWRCFKCSTGKKKRTYSEIKFLRLVLLGNEDATEAETPCDLNAINFRDFYI